MPYHVKKVGLGHWLVVNSITGEPRSRHDNLRDASLKAGELSGYERLYGSSASSSRSIGRVKRNPGLNISSEERWSVVLSDESGIYSVVGSFPTRSFADGWVSNHARLIGELMLEASVEPFKQPQDALREMKELLR